MTELPETPCSGGASSSAHADMSQEALLTDYMLQGDERGAPETTGLVIPVTVDDFAANGLLEEAYPPVCWKRSVETLTARKGDLAGHAIVPDERFEAYLLYLEDGELVALRSFIEDGGARLKQLLPGARGRH